MFVIKDLIIVSFTFTLITILSLHLNTAGLNKNDKFVVSLVLSFSRMEQLPMSLTYFQNNRYSVLSLKDSVTQLVT